MTAHGAQYVVPSHKLRLSNSTVLMYPKEMTKYMQHFLLQGKNWKQPKFPTMGEMGYDSFTGWNEINHFKTEFHS